MRWRKSFLAEVDRTLRQLGLRACPICGSAESLTVSQSPAILVDAGFLPDEDVFPGENPDGEMTFAVRIECTTCGHLMLFNAERYRTGDEKILTRGLADEESQLGE